MIGDRIQFVQRFDGLRVVRLGEIKKEIAANGKCKAVVVVLFDDGDTLETLHADTVTTV